jgi:N-acetylmuramoyl-L-alanine amidase
MNERAIRPCRILLSLPTSNGRRYLPRTMKRALLAVFAVVVGCRPAAVAAPEPRPAVTPTIVRGALPPVPLVEGPLSPKVVYPHPNGLIQSKDSTFILGSVGNGKATLTVNGQEVRVWPNGAFLGFVANPPPTAPQYDLVAVLGADTARVSQPVRVAGMTPPVPDTVKVVPPTVVDTTPAWVVLGDSASVVTDTDRVIIGRPGPNSVYRWFLFPGTRVQLTARYPGFARVRLDSALQIWVEAVDAKTFATDTAAPKRVAGNAKVRATPEYSDLLIPVTERPAFFVEERDRSLELTLYDTRASTDLVNYPTTDSLIKHVEWAAERSDRVRYSVRLTQEPFGYLVLYENGTLTLRVRRKPAPLSPTTHHLSPLAGLTIAVDPGHPPAGANGPTGLYEADAVLPVGLALQKILEQRGASVVLTRTTRDAVDLAMRPIIARRAGAHAFVSLHYDAYGDGVNPLRMPNGVEVYFYRPHSEPLARAVQSAMVAHQPLPDQGVDYRSLAVVRISWMPSVLAEGGVIIIPEQENAMRTPEYQERYARAVADGLENYFRGIRSR